VTMARNGERSPSFDGVAASAGVNAANEGNADGWVVAARATHKPPTKMPVRVLMLFSFADRLVR